MKKKYMTPEMKVLEIKRTVALLAGSMMVNSLDGDSFTYGGEGNPEEDGY